MSRKALSRTSLSESEEDKEARAGWSDPSGKEFGTTWEGSMAAGGREEILWGPCKRGKYFHLLL